MIYDNACNLHNYCLNRELQYFKNTWFIVDRFHWRNHTGYDDNVIIVNKQCYQFLFFFFTKQGAVLDTKCPHIHSSLTLTVKLLNSAIQS